MFGKEKVENPFTEWPKTTVLKEGGIHITGKYIAPETVPRIQFVAFLFALWAFIGGASGGAAGAAIVLPVAILIGVLAGEKSLGTTFGRNLDIKIFPDKIQFRDGGFFYKTYARKFPIEFRIDEHQKAIHEELAARSGAKRSRKYREALEVVMQYGEKRVAVAAFRLKEMKQARALVIRLQNVCNSIDAAMELVSSGNSDRALTSGTDFGPSPQIR
ncbi:MAG TPA: hypothetical protein VEA77_03375 [Hyphomicrobium sp.]|nr:hypothetical protein [Hyphomicrobium sp.]